MLLPIVLCSYSLRMYYLQPMKLCTAQLAQAACPEGDLAVPLPPRKKQGQW